MSWTRVLTINLVVMLLLLICVEIGGRLLWTIRSCGFDTGCNFSRIIRLKIRDMQNGDIQLSIFDPRLGYIPKPDFKKNIALDNWDNSLVSINSDGFRSNDNGVKGAYKVLVVGDSFTFGDQVSNNQTWPSCLERIYMKKVANAGVFGFGAAQSVKRAMVETNLRTFDTVILSILVTDDFKRDQMRYKSGLPRPAVIKVGTETKWASVPEIIARPNSSRITKILLSMFQFKVLFQHSQFFSTFMINVFPNYDYFGNRYNEKHPNSASENEIIKFTFKKFNEIQVQKKFILLQYTFQDFNIDRKMINKMRRLIKETSQSYDIPIIDSYDKLAEDLATKSRKKIWNGHHTPLGNNLVCDLVYSAIR